MARHSTDRIKRVLHGLLGMPATDGNAVTVLKNGVEIFPAMLSEIGRATDTVDFCCYVFSESAVGEKLVRALKERAEAGVRVRLLLDPFGSRELKRSWVRELRSAGADVAWFRLPSDWRVWEQNNRNHRRVVLCDERVALTGGYGIADRWDGDARSPAEWRDLAVRVEGPAVDGFRAAFANNWAATGRPPFDRRDRFPDPEEVGDVTALAWQGAGGPGWNDSAIVLTTLLALAEKRIRLTTPYFAPRDDDIDRLCEAADRGVEVQLLLPGPNADQRVLQLAAQAHFARLLDAGIQVWIYLPTMIHQKSITIDGEITLVGTPNFDPRSLQLNDENGVVVFDAEVTERVDGYTDHDLTNSELIDAERWEKRGVGQRVGELAVDLIDSQL